MTPANFFKKPTNPRHQQYEALRAFFVDKLTAEEVAKQFGYTKSTVYSLTRDFQSSLKSDDNLSTHFFVPTTVGRKPAGDHEQVRTLIISLRKKYLSVPDIRSILNAQGQDFCERYIHQILKEEGFARLPRRSQPERHITKSQVTFEAPKAVILSKTSESFSSADAGVLLFLRVIKQYGIDALIERAGYPGTQHIPALNSILAFVALKLCNVRRYHADDLWCMDRGLGLFAGLNVLPKTAWFTSYASRVTRTMNLKFLKCLCRLWQEQGLLSGTNNLDFVTVPYWGEEAHLQNNWSGTRHHALPSILAALAQDPDSGIITYGDSCIRHENGSETAMEFLDFYKQAGETSPQFLVFDSKFTTYENLSKIDDNGVKFITIRRRGQKIIQALNQLPTEQWKHVTVPASKGKSRKIKIYDSNITIKRYGMDKIIRQVAITGHGKLKPALIISNDFDISSTEIVRKYAKRWLIEKTISEQTHFFHLNRLSSSMVIKVDFDLTMTILSHNLYRLLAQALPGYENATAQTLYEKFIYNAGTVTCDEKKSWFD